jgi:hypothetical protein
MIKVSFDKEVAIFMDSENKGWKCIDYIEQILKISEYIGFPVSCYAYGNWNTTNLSNREKVDALKIDRIQVNSGKNATDNRILIDVGKSLGDLQNRIDIYVIVSSDGDFASLCQPILEEGKEVICIGTKGGTSKFLEKLPVIYYLEDLDQHLSELDSHYVIPLNVLRIFENFLILSYHPLGFGNHNEDWVSYTLLERKMREFPAPGYEFYFGKYEFAQLISYFSDDFEIEHDRIKWIDHYPEETRRSWLIKAYYENRDRDINSKNPVHIGKLGKTLREIDKYYENHWAYPDIVEGKGFSS